MRKLGLLILVSVFAFSCQEKVNYASFGEKIDDSHAVSVAELSNDYADLKPGDTLDVKFKGTIKEVCSKKGCWMKVGLADNQDTFVRFKDYGFFVPMNAADLNTVVSGKAFVTETSVAELKHYAKDAGKTEEEIAQITAPERQYAFIASGVLIEEQAKATEE